MIPESKGKKWILIALMFTMMLAAIDTTIVSTAIPDIVGDLGGFALFGWVFSIYLLTQTVTIPIYGKLADIYGRKPILILGTIVFLIGSAASAASWDMTSLILFRGLQGLGAGSVMATVNTLAGDLYDIRERAKVQGWFSSVWGMAAIVGPTLGGAFAEYASWRWIFLINIPIGIVAIALIVIHLHEKSPHGKHHIDYFGAALMLAGGTVLVYTLLQGGQSWAWDSPKGFLFLGLSIALIAAIVWVERKSAEPIMPTWIWTRKILVGSNLATLAMGAIMIGPTMYLPIYGQSVLGLGAIAAGFVLASTSLTWPLSSSLSGRLYLRIGFRNSALIGVVLILVATGAFTFIPYGASVWLVVADQLVLGAGFGLLSTPSLVGIQSIVPWSQRGVVTGSNMFSRYLGQTIGAAVLGAVFNAAIRQDLSAAPQVLKPHLPSKVNEVIEVMQAKNTAMNVVVYLREAFYGASHHVYAVMAVMAILALLCLLLLPRHYPIVKEGKN